MGRHKKIVPSNGSSNTLRKFFGLSETPRNANEPDAASANTQHSSKASVSSSQEVLNVENVATIGTQVEAASRTELEVGTQIEGVAAVTEGLVENGGAKRAKRKRESGSWDVGRKFQFDWAAEFPFLERVQGEDKDMVICTICKWRDESRGHPIQAKKDTIYKHIGKTVKLVEESGVKKEIIIQKTTHQSYHVRSVELYEVWRTTNLLKDKGATPIQTALSKSNMAELEAKSIQMRVVFTLLNAGSPMHAYTSFKGFCLANSMRNCPSTHWSEPLGWEFAAHMSEVVKQDLREVMHKAPFLALSIDEYTARDNTSWVCIHVYSACDYERKSDFLSMSKLPKDSTAASMYEEVLRSLQSVAGFSKLDCHKFVCFGADGASVMAGCRGGLGIRLQTSIMPYIVPIHCMAHRTNLAYKICSDFAVIAKVETLIRTSYKFFSKSPKRAKYFSNFSIGLTEGRKLLKDVDTRWISIHGPAQRLADEYVTLIGVTKTIGEEDVDAKVKAAELFALLIDGEALIALFAMLPMMNQLNILIKIAQEKTLFIPEYACARRGACWSLDNMYVGEDCFLRKDKKGKCPFHKLNQVLDIESGKSFLKFNSSGDLCICVKDHMILLKAQIGRHKKALKKSDFDGLVNKVKAKLHKVATSLSSELRSRFPADKILDAMGIVFPLAWNSCRSPESTLVCFENKLEVLAEHFGKKTVVDGVEINGLIDANALYLQSGAFGSTMALQFKVLPKPTEFGAVTRLWQSLEESTYLKESIGEYLILGSVEDERTFSTMTFVKDQLRNRLDDNLDTTIRLYKSSYRVESFPYDMAFELWKSACTRRGTNNVYPESIIVTETMPLEKAVDVEEMGDVPCDANFWQLKRK